MSARDRRSGTRFRACREKGLYKLDRLREHQWARTAVVVLVGRGVPPPLFLQNQEAENQ